MLRTIFPKEEPVPTTPANLFIPPMEAEPTRHIPEGDAWQHEPKFDGYRALVVRHSGETYVFSRRGHIFNQRFQRLTRALQKLPGKSFALDGEIVAFNAEGKITFELVQEPHERSFPVYFVAFDLMHFGGTDLMKLPLHERRKRLESAFPSWVQFTSLCPTATDPAAVLQSVREFELEGIVSKRRDSIYAPGQRPGTWLKLKTQETGDFVVGGYLPGWRNFEELLVGRWEGKKLLFMESVRNGFMPHSRAQVFEQIEPLVTKSCPFANLPEKGAGHMNEEKMKEARWVKPKVVVEVAFNNVTSGGHLRHARFVRLRLDKV
jgi:bifunctional non-homologous end joining protein LigD